MTSVYRNVYRIDFDREEIQSAKKKSYWPTLSQSSEIHRLPNSYLMASKRNLWSSFLSVGFVQIVRGPIHRMGSLGYFLEYFFSMTVCSADHRIIHPNFEVALYFFKEVNCRLTECIVEERRNACIDTAFDTALNSQLWSAAT